LTIVQKYRVTVSHIVPPIVIALAKSPVVAQYDISSVRMVMSGAAPLGAEIQQEAARRLGVIVKQGYGMSELSPVSHTNPTNRAVPGTWECTRHLPRLNHLAVR
jgi:acyl-CoA synthetase (AMP-forming)/AMP-acid ligase II